LTRDAALLEDSANLGGIEVLELVKVDACEQILLLVSELGQIILAR
jgi:hypothetical protein